MRGVAFCLIATVIIRHPKGGIKLHLMGQHGLKEYGARADEFFEDTHSQSNFREEHGHDMYDVARLFGTRICTLPV
jgi:hypothetical protein